MASHQPYFYEVDRVRFLHVHRVLSCSLLCFCHTDLHFSQQSRPPFHHLHKKWGEKKNKKKQALIWMSHVYSPQAGVMVTG